jgi:hypothetical protein
MDDAKPLFSHRKYWARRFGTAPFPLDVQIRFCSIHISQKLCGKAKTMKADESEKSTEKRARSFERAAAT